MDLNYYLDRWNRWQFPIAVVPNKLNPFAADGVVISVVLMGHLPYENSKFITVLGLLQGATKRRVLYGVDTLVESTSGNTGLVLSSVARFFGISRVILVVNPNLPPGKRIPLVLSGAEVIAPNEGMSGIATARMMGGGGWKPDDWQSNGPCLNLDQYANPDGTELHTKYTAEKILAQMDNNPPTVFVAGMGTGGTLIGISNRFRKRLKNISIVGVLASPENEIPGVRDLNQMKEVKLPWRESLDKVMQIKAKPSYLASMWLSWVMGLTVGPSSGFAYLGALKFLKQSKKDGTLDKLRNRKGKVNVTILFADIRP